jgi:hypothetical protein
MNRQRHSLSWLILAAAATFFALGAEADNFGRVRYDRQTDRLVVTMIYRGTNPNHHFSLKWGPCQANQSGDQPGVTAQVLDDQYDDAAEQDFTKTVRFDLARMPCPRPVSVSLRTAPRFFYTLMIPK